jgi:trehalose 6-phosphate phosphatase
MHESQQPRVPQEAHRLQLSDGLTHLCRQAVLEHWLLAFDFDGTLATFTNDPNNSVMSAAAMDNLTQLAFARTVAVVSGRALADLRERLPCAVLKIGNHGAEGLWGSPAVEDGARACVKTWIDSAARIKPETECWIENKGLSISIHWRAAQDIATAMRDANEIAIQLYPRARIIPGEMILNCLPPALPDKGLAMQRLLQQEAKGRALFIGDDWTDATIFRSGDPRITGIQVGQYDLGAAWRVPDQAFVEVILRTMAQALLPGSRSDPIRNRHELVP